MSRANPEVLGLIAGAGTFPMVVARSARGRGQAVVAVAFPEHTDPRIEEEAAKLTWLHPGELGAALDALRSAGVRDAVMAGKVPKASLYSEGAALRLDTEARRLLRGLRDRRDDSLLRALAGTLQEHGIRLLPQAQLVPELMAGEGPLGRTRPTPEQAADIAFGWSIAKTMAGLDIGQTVVVKDRAVLAVEAIEGTDAAIRRGGGVGAGAAVVKVAKPDQDPRFDLPAIGLDTVSSLIEVRASALAFEAGRTVVLDREKLPDLADAHGVALLGVDPARLAGEPA
jgi:DUF1009 family protein